MSAILAPLFEIQAPAEIDADTVRRILTEHAVKIGLDDSNRKAAFSWALLHGRNTFNACQVGKKRADVLRGRQVDPRPAA